MRLRDSEEAVRMAFETLRTNKLRSGLTVLGISIGISTVILISSAINGLNSNIDGFVKSLGTNTLWIFRFEPFGGRPSTEMLNRKQLTYDDAWATAMQHSGVMEDDFKQWLNEWKAQHLIEVLNLRPDERPTRKGKHQYLKWLAK